jgi:hypothetical protein
MASPAELAIRIAASARASVILKEVQMTKREELLEAGYGCVVKGREAHLTESFCWTDDDWLIPLKDLDEAEGHGYEICKRCRSSTSVPAMMEPLDTSELT